MKDIYTFLVRLDFETYRRFKIYCIDNHIHLKDGVSLAIKSLLEKDNQKDFI